MAKVVASSTTLLLFAAMTSSALAGDLKYTSRLLTGIGPPHDTVHYLKGERKRIDSRNYVGGETPESFVYGPRTAMIMQCDLDRELHLNLDAKKYLVQPFKALPVKYGTTGLNAVQMAGSNGADPANSEERHITLVETGDKKQFYGHEAWLVRQTTNNVSHYAGKTYNSTRVGENWYIDLDVPMFCPKKYGLPPNERLQSRLVLLGQNVKETRTGSARTGFLISQRENDSPLSGIHGFSTELVDWSEQPLDPKLFEIPEGFVETTDWNEIYPQLRARQLSGLRDGIFQWVRRLLNVP